MTPRIAVLLGTYNGARYLEQQLESLQAQTLRPQLVLVSDDGSSDETLQIVWRFADHFPGDVECLTGPRGGVAANYLHLIRHCPAVDMVAFCDQDDVWLPQKLAKQWARLSAITPPALHGAPTWRTDADLKRKGQSTFRQVTPSLEHALVQNLAGANTMALNAEGLALAQIAAKRVSAAPFHDWWLYQLFAATGAEMIYENDPQVLYRQHRANVVGNNQSLVATLRRAVSLQQGLYSQWVDLNLANLKLVEDHCTAEARALVDAFAEMRAASLLARLAAFRKLRLRRHGWHGQMALWTALIAGKV